MPLLFDSFTCDSDSMPSDRRNPEWIGQLTGKRTVHIGEMAEIPDGASVAVFGINTKAQSIMCRGRFNRLKRFGKVLIAGLAIDYVYNTMPPKQGPVFPSQPLRPVTDF